MSPFAKLIVVIIPVKWRNLIRKGCEKRNYISENELTPVKLLNTHCHIDHVLGNSFVASKYNVGLEMHEKDLPTLHATPEYGHTFGFNVDKSPEPTVLLSDGDVVKFGDSELSILFTPGHSPGHIVFVSHEDKFVINGDVLFYGSIGRTDLPGGNYNMLISNIKNNMEDNVVVFSYTINTSNVKQI